MLFVCLFVLVGVMRMAGSKSWTAFLISVGIDLFTHTVHFSFKNRLKKDQRAELYRRSYIMLIYFLWSPFYEFLFKNKVSKKVYTSLLNWVPAKQIIGKNKHKRKQIYYTRICMFVFFFQRDDSRVP